tara:strand:+ start:1157 stop:1666 length:510 start_codon:yes stop_codon:yes gene_type:complete
MSGEIVNRVEKSGLMTIDLDEIKLPNSIFEIDIKKWLFEKLFLKEKEFRKSIHNHDWSAYTNAYVYVHCSSDAIIPTWAYMLISSQLEKFTKQVIIGNERKFFEKYFEDAINSIDFSVYLDKSVIIKGCSNKKIPISAYHILTTKLKPLAKSIMFGEACSAVPVFKRTK